MYKERILTQKETESLRSASDMLDYCWKRDREDRTDIWHLSRSMALKRVPSRGKEYTATELARLTVAQAEIVSNYYAGRLEVRGSLDGNPNGPKILAPVQRRMTG